MAQSVHDSFIVCWLQVRRLSESAGLEVVGLKRVRVGGFRIPKDLGLGEFRELKPYHVKQVSDRA